MAAIATALLSNVFGNSEAEKALLHGGTNLKIIAFMD